ncbi:MAG: alpha/beta hydrolase [Ruminococcus sp.]|nr:alpha/beta hydrolase [Ruminococcus sp.]MBR1393965.1 alpha/beta hydrolase [Ruminococcus sp.]
MSTMITSTFKSRDNVHDICYHVWFPEGEPRGVVQIAHGMSEYSKRYAPFAEFLAANGYIACANDHLGHGDSVRELSELGYFSETEGWENAVKDMHTLTKMMKDNYPELPYFLFGHSMGSFLARAYTTWFGRELDGAVYCGTAGPVKAGEMLLLAVDAAKKKNGPTHRSNTINKVAFGQYNKRIEDARTEYDWLSRDDDIVDAYIADEKCGFVFTLNGFENLGKLLWFVSQEKWFSTMRKDLPILLIAGDADPVGDYGEGVKKVFNKLISYCCSARVRIYEGARHELLNELNKDEVYDDVLRFIETYTLKR